MIHGGLLRSASLLCIVLASAACTRRAPAIVAESAEVDSLILERTPCYGTCPAYRISIARSGVVEYQTRDPGESTRASGTVAPSVLDTLAARATSMGFHTLPDTVRKDRSLCLSFATDHSTIIVGIYGKRPKEVVYYTGCYIESGDGHVRAPPLERLAAFATLVDSLAGSRKWIDPRRLQ